MKLTNDSLLNIAYVVAEKQANQAKPFILKQDGKIYTGVFNTNEWVYDVFEDGFFMMKINMKQASKAKQYLSTWLKS